MRGVPDFFKRWIGGRCLSVNRLLAVSWLLAAPLYAADEYGYGVKPFDFDESLAEKWKETKVAIPAFPQDADLLSVVLPPTDTLKIYMDRKSISRAADRVARFTLVVESPSGARSVFYEGMRCETRQYKIYAVGTPEKNFVTLKDSAWQTIPRSEINAFRDYLNRQYVCDSHKSARAPDELLRMIQQSTSPF